MCLDNQVGEDDAFFCLFLPFYPKAVLAPSNCTIWIKIVRRDYLSHHTLHQQTEQFTWAVLREKVPNVLSGFILPLV